MEDIRKSGAQDNITSHDTFALQSCDDKGDSGKNFTLSLEASMPSHSEPEHEEPTNEEIEQLDRTVKRVASEPSTSEIPWIDKPISRNCPDTLETQRNEDEVDLVEDLKLSHIQTSISQHPEPGHKGMTDAEKFNQLPTALMQNSEQLEPYAGDLSSTDKGFSSSTSRETFELPLDENSIGLENELELLQSLHLPPMSTHSELRFDEMIKPEELENLLKGIEEKKVEADPGMDNMLRFATQGINTSQGTVTPESYDNTVYSGQKHKHDPPKEYLMSQLSSNSLFPPIQTACRPTELKTTHSLATVAANVFAPHRQQLEQHIESQLYQQQLRTQKNPEPSQYSLHCLLRQTPHPLFVAEALNRSPPKAAFSRPEEKLTSHSVVDTDDAEIPQQPLQRPAEHQSHKQQHQNNESPKLAPIPLSQLQIPMKKPKLFIKTQNLSSQMENPERSSMCQKSQGIIQRTSQPTFGLPKDLLPSQTVAHSLDASERTDNQPYQQTVQLPYQQQLRFQESSDSAPCLKEILKIPARKQLPKMDPVSLSIPRPLTPVTDDMEEKEELQLFIQIFTQRRIDLGMSHTDVNLEISKLQGEKVTDISSFENLSLSPENMRYHKSLLQSWLKVINTPKRRRNRQWTMAGSSSTPGHSEPMKRVQGIAKESLEKVFLENPNPTDKSMAMLAESFNLTETAVQNWFRNRRLKKTK